MSTAENDARILAAVARQAADETVKRTNGKQGCIVEVPVHTYVSVLRALSACAEGQHTTALQRLADAFCAPIEEWRSVAREK